MANLFGTLNRFIARLDSDSGPPSKGPSGNTYGFQVLRNNDTNLALEPWFDFVIGINGRTIDNADPSLFAQEIRNCAGSTISLGVYGVKGQQIREIYASIPPDASGLGLSLQWMPLGVSDDVWHILDVMPNSPADVAGLLPYGDYVIGSPDGQMRGEAALGDLVEAFMGQPLRLFVYNHEYDVTRMVTITPAKNWGGDGALGCVLGYGALHRVPAPLTEPTQAPGETLFESGNDYSLPPSGPEEAAAFPPSSGGQDFLVPANMDIKNPSPPPPQTGKARKQRPHHALPAAGLDDYFAEGEQNSREIEEDTAPKPRGNRPPPSKPSSLPPPPKGGPPKATSPAPSSGD